MDIIGIQARLVAYLILTSAALIAGILLEKYDE
jgi:hypothetical protein